MQTTILIKEGRVQLVLHPESDHDKEVIKILEKMPNTHRDNFYDCEGGWTRHNRGYYGGGYDSPDRNPDLMIVFDDNKKEEVEA